MPLARKSLITPALLALSLTAGCAQEPPAKNETHAASSEDAAMAGAKPSTTVAGQIERLILADQLESELRGDVTASAVEAARAAYAQQLFKPLWSRRAASKLADAVDNSFEYGVWLDEADSAEIDALAEKIKDRDEETRARADLDLTAAYLRLASEVSGGLRDEGAVVDPRDDAGNPSVVTQSILQAAAGDVYHALHSLEPNNIHYNRLKKALNEYRTIYADGGWYAIDAGPAVEPGDSDERLPAIRERLAAEGFLQNPRAPNETALIYDDKTVDAISTFQRRHGLEPDGVIGGSTLDAMNESVESKIDAIVDNMHRWRVQDDLGRRYVIANIPSFSAEGWSGNRREIAMRTIVGRRDRQTPIFNDNIEFAVANPKWYAPRSIVQKDKLPKLRDDPGYATRGRYTIIDRETGESVDPYKVDWDDDDAAERFQLIQSEGEQNALGELKIMFPNQYSVYLHGTPDEGLFDKAQRAFSSGCVRLEDPVAMAQWIARRDPAVSPNDVSTAVESGDNTHLDFERATPIHITYFTVTVDENGDANFWRDIYRKDDGVEYARKAAPYQSARRKGREKDL